MYLFKIVNIVLFFMSSSFFFFGGKEGRGGGGGVGGRGGGMGENKKQEIHHMFARIICKHFLKPIFRGGRRLEVPRGVLVFSCFLVKFGFDNYMKIKF